jgi:hypothetical protein
MLDGRLLPTRVSNHSGLRCHISAVALKWCGYSVGTVLHRKEEPRHKPLLWRGLRNLGN